jgi:MFS family permease
MAKSPSSVGAPTGTPSVGRIALVIVIGILATTLCQPAVLGKLPLQFLLKNELHQDRSSLATFFLIIGIPWYCKPIAGVLTDAFPLFRTRRQWYIIISTLVATLGWFYLGSVKHDYNALLGACLLVNTAMVIASTALGAYIVEASQRLGASGRITALRLFTQNSASLINGPVSGFLAAGAFLTAASISGGLLFLLAPAAFLLMKEPKTEQSTPAVVLQNAKEQMRSIGKSRSLWAASAFIFLLYIAPGFQTPLLFKQTDELKFSTQFIGTIQFVSAAGALLAAVAYSFLCKRFNLKRLIIGSVITAGAGSLFYLFYSGQNQALIIEFQNGFFFGLAEIAVLDLAVRATPVGAEGLGFALLVSFRNLAIFSTDVIGSKLVDDYKFKFEQLVWLNSASTLFVLVLLPLLPRQILSYRDGVAAEKAEEEAGASPTQPVSGNSLPPT